jgi:hypothetical protein
MLLDGSHPPHQIREDFVDESEAQVILAKV